MFVRDKLEPPFVFSPWQVFAVGGVLTLTIVIAVSLYVSSEEPINRLVTLARTGDTLALSRLAQNGLPSRIHYLHGRSLLHVAARHNQTEMLELLLSRGARVDRSDSAGSTPLMVAAFHGHEAAVQKLLRKGANPSRRDYHGSTALMYGARRGRIRVVGTLLEFGAEVNAAAPSGGTALMDAALGGHRDVVRLLLQHGARLNRKDRNGATPLSLALLEGHVSLAHTLLDLGANPARFSSSLSVAHATRLGDTGMVRRLLEHGGNPNGSWNGLPAPVIAAFEKHERILKQLLAHGADPNVTTRSPSMRPGATPLMAAAVSGSRPALRMLVKNGAEVHARDAAGMTPLMYAASFGRVEAVIDLLRAGADPTTRDHRGRDALELARMKHHNEVIERLEGAAHRESSP